MTEQTTNQEETVDDEPEGQERSGPGAEGSSGPSRSGSETAAGADEGGSGDQDPPPDQARDFESRGSRKDGAGAPDKEGDEAGTTELVALREEFESLNDRHLRLVAEFNNFRRRSEQERMAAWGRAQADLVSKLLDVLDDLHRVAELDLSNASVDAIMEGIDLVEKKFMRQLQEAGVEVIEPEGETFDPERMEAMMRVPAEEDEQVDTVAQVFQKGYSLKDTLVRPARVSVYTQG